MATKPGRSPEDWIQFLISLIEYTPAKPDWNQFAADTGSYKSGKFVAQAYGNLRRKYGALPGAKVEGTPAPSTPKTPRTPKTPKSGKATKKRAANFDEDDPDGIPMKARKVKKEEIKDEDADGEVFFKEEYEDEVEEQLADHYDLVSDEE